MTAASVEQARERSILAAELQETWPVLSAEERLEGLRVLPHAEAEEFLLALPARDQAEIILQMSPGDRRSWMRLLPPDDAADVIQESPEEEREGLLGKIGVRNETFKAGEHKDLLSPLRGATPEERRIVQSILDSLHARFVSVVRESRPKLDAGRITELTDGRIFDASQALDAGLVDGIGSLRDAVALAQKAAGLEKARVVMYRRADERRENLYSRADGPAQVNLLALDLAAVAGDGPRFMYLWAPGLLR